MKNLETMSTQELKVLREKINKELSLREQQTTCIWSIRGIEKKKEEPAKIWEGEKYIS